MGFVNTHDLAPRACKVRWDGLKSVYTYSISFIDILEPTPAIDADQLRDWHP